MLVDTRSGLDRFTSGIPGNEGTLASEQAGLRRQNHQFNPPPEIYQLLKPLHHRSAKHMSKKETDKSTQRKAKGEAETSIVSQGRHEFHCRICCHPKREEIDQAFVTWTSPIQIAENYGVSRDSVYRHAHALSLFDKRSRNVRSALERIIEKAGDVEVTAAAVVSAIAAYAKINANGQWVERSETINLNELFDRMTSKEMDHYAKQGTLPAWFEHILGATGSDSRSGPNDC